MVAHELSEITTEHSAKSLNKVLIKTDILQFYTNIMGGGKFQIKDEKILFSTQILHFVGQIQQFVEKPHINYC